MGQPATLDYEAMSEREICRRLAAGDSLAVRLVVRRHNQRLYRSAWSVLKNRADAEEAVQEGYLKAFASIERFMGDSSLATWLTRIVVNEAISRLRAADRRRRSLRQDGLALLQDCRDRLAATPSLAAAPEEALMRREFADLLERAVARLGDPLRIVFVLHEIEGLSAAEVSESLGIPVETVRTRLFRARRRLRVDLEPELRSAFGGAIAFAGADCDALTERVLAAFEAARKTHAKA
jgi:RNA polymerase sigma-70 factor, ECF subfamily